MSERNALTIVEGSYRLTPVERIPDLYGLPATAEWALIVADYRDVYDGRRDQKNVERGPVALVDLPRTAQLLRSRGFHNLRFHAA